MTQVRRARVFAVSTIDKKDGSALENFTRRVGVRRPRDHVFSPRAFVFDRKQDVWKFDEIRR